MAKVYNWQLGREMDYCIRGRPEKQFADVFDTNKCIACQTCTLACKTTWTSGKGQEYMFWNNVETKPYGCYPLAWDSKLLDKLERPEWNGNEYRGPDDLRVPRRPASASLGWRPEDQDYAYPNIGEDDCAGQVDQGALPLAAAHEVDLLPGAHLQPLHYPACLAACPRGRSTSGRRTASCWSTRAAAAATRSASRPAPTRRSSSTR